MTVDWPVPIEGGCACGHLRYRLEEAPMYIHCCNCQECQRQHGTAFALNAFIETEKVTLLPPLPPSPLPPREAAPPSANAAAAGAGAGAGAVTRPKHILMPSSSGAGQLVARCPRCQTAVWSYYGGAGPATCFIKVGTVDKFTHDGRSLDAVLKPDAYIFTKYKMPWVEFPTGEAEKAVVQEFYDREKFWSPLVKERWAKIVPKMKAWQKHKDWSKCEGLHIDVDATKVAQNEDSLERRVRDLKL